MGNRTHKYERQPSHVWFNQAIYRLEGKHQEKVLDYISAGWKHTVRSGNVIYEHLQQIYPLPNGQIQILGTIQKNTTDWGPHEGLRGCF